MILARFASLAHPAAACAVCFGKSDNIGLFRGLTWGLFVLLGSTFFILAWLTAAILRVERRKAAADAALLR